MLRLSSVAFTLALGLHLLASNASAQWGYPMGYGGYGMSKWGQDPGAGYMAGLGSFARGQGAYQLDKAKADAINVETMVKWNKALRARQAALREDKQKEEAKERAELAVRVDRLELKDGTTLNTLLAQILDIDPAGLKSGRANAPISPAAIREIPFRVGLGSRYLLPQRDDRAGIAADAARRPALCRGPQRPAPDDRYGPGRRSQGHGLDGHRPPNQPRHR